MENVNEYQTKDFYTAAFLLAKGYEIANVNRTEPKRVFFVFNDFEDREDLIRAFLYGKAVIEPQAFIAAIKTLKGLIHSYD
jgi:hypothetical protein